MGRRQVVISSFDSPGNPHYNGGGAAVVELIACCLAAEYDVTFVTAGYPDRHGAGRGAPAATHAELRYRYLPVGWAGPRAGQLLYHAMLPALARRIPHDLWIENFTPPWSTSFVPVFSRAKVVGLAQNLSGRQMWRRYRVPFFLVERVGLRCYRHLVVLNGGDGEHVRQVSPASSVRVIPNGIALPRVDQELIGRGEHVLFMGRIDVWHKGLDLLIAAYRQSGTAMPLVIAGAGTRAEERKLSLLLDGVGGAGGMGGEVRWVGHVTGASKQDLLTRSAFVVMPSRVETFGLVALEGMAWGKPVLHFDLPTLDWMHGDVGVKAYDVGALADAIRDLAADQGLRRKLGGAAHGAAQGFGVDQTASRYLELARELLAEPVARRQ